MKIRPVILSGGSGTRLWPVSRRCVPKPFVPLMGNESLFAAALKRVGDSAVFAPPLIIANVEHKFLILGALKDTGIKDAHIVLEPEGRNTAPAAIIAALAEDEPDMLHLVVPSDHVIADREAFADAVRYAAAAARQDHIVLFGIAPTRPETGYGYIRTGEETAWDRVHAIETFAEKPNVERARELIKAGALWNSGIFLYKPEVLIEEATRFVPECVKLCDQALSRERKDADGVTLDPDTYAEVKAESFDRAIMEATNCGCVVPCSFGWSDAGSWQSLWQIEEHDDNGNSFLGPVVSRDVANAYIRSDGPMVAAIGVKDVAVVATRDAVLIVPRERSQDVNAMVAEIERRNPGLTSNTMQVIKPWGTYESLAQGDMFQVKHIVVEPGCSLSLQQHHHRAEHWIVVGGTARAECDGVERLIYPNESFFIPRGGRHRLTNPGRIPLHLIEVQSGDYLGEDDIIRFDDVYGRAEPALAQP